LLFALASLATGIYYGNTWAISYPTPVSAGLLWSHRATLTLASLRQAWSLGAYDAAFVASVLAWPILLSRRSRRAALVAAGLPLLTLFPVNLLGGYVAVVELLLRPGWDGETLAEGWPLVEVYGLWSLWSLAYLLSLRQRASSGMEPTGLGATT
jgi:hypothetical protein